MDDATRDAIVREAMQAEIADLREKFAAMREQVRGIWRQLDRLDTLPEDVAAMRAEMRAELGHVRGDIESTAQYLHAIKQGMGAQQTATTTAAVADRTNKRTVAGGVLGALVTAVGAYLASKGGL